MTCFFMFFHFLTRQLKQSKHIHNPLSSPSRKHIHFSQKKDPLGFLDLFFLSKHKPLPKKEPKSKKPIEKINPTFVNHHLLFDIPNKLSTFSPIFAGIRSQFFSTQNSHLKNECKKYSPRISVQFPIFF